MPGGHRITCMATYADASQATGTAVIQIDRTAPNSPQITPNHGAAPTAASPSSLCRLLLRTVAGCRRRSVVSGLGGIQRPGRRDASVSKSCTDQAGNTGSGSFAFKYDATGPTGVAAALPASNRGNWHNHAVRAREGHRERVVVPVAPVRRRQRGGDARRPGGVVLEREAPAAGVARLSAHDLLTLAVASSGPLYPTEP